MTVSVLELIALIDLVKYFCTGARCELYMEITKEKRKMVIPLPGASPTSPTPHLRVRCVRCVC
ncbi:MAG: hypothetical protein F6K31_11055 [Symploca sp. SIO2G7]|nr:hypothetical protein [Symploca sp. SIO2G7]